MKNALLLLFAAGMLLPSFARLEASPPDFPMRCHGAAGMATADRNKLTINFRPGSGPADRGLAAGQCSWLDRGLRPGEPTRIIDLRPTPGEARITAQHINSGAIHTFLGL